MQRLSKSCRLGYNVYPMQQNLNLKIYDCGLKEYDKALQFQHILVNHRRQGKIPNTVIIVEHLPVVTLGARESANKLLVTEEELAKENIDLAEIRRGGGATAHNPGQLVFYPIFDLNQLGLSVTEYVRQLEAIGIELLGKFGVQCGQNSGFPGLWVGKKKIASIGVRVSRQITYHGMAINISNDLSIFDNIVPCGLDGIEMTSVLKETGKAPAMEDVKKALQEILKKFWAATGTVEYENR
jgi:lipoate-protein ligase B